MHTINLDTSVLDERWRTYLEQVDPHKILQATYNHTGWNNQGEVSLVLTNDAHIQELNNLYRYKNHPTNVLSFASIDGMDKKAFFLQPEPISFGDIIISLDTLEKEALEEKKTAKNHFIHLLIHGMLHLQGYDHESDADAELMEGMEIHLLSLFNIQNPYII